MKNGTLRLVRDRIGKSVFSLINWIKFAVLVCISLPFYPFVWFFSDEDWKDSFKMTMKIIVLIFEYAWHDETGVGGTE